MVELILWMFGVLAIGFLLFPWIGIPVKLYWEWCENVKQKRGW